MKLYTDFESFNKKKLFEADYFKDVKSSGKFGEIETGLEVETTPVDISYDIPNDILDEIIDKLKSEPSNVLDFDVMSKDVIAKKIINVILHKFVRSENINIFDLQGEDEPTDDYDMQGEIPTLDGLKENLEVDIEENEPTNPGAPSLGLNSNKLIPFNEFSKDEYKEECSMECSEEIEKLRNEYDADAEEIEDFKIKFEEGEVKSASEYANMFMYEDEDGDDDHGHEHDHSTFSEENLEGTGNNMEDEDETMMTPVVRESIKSFDDFVKSRKSNK